MSGIDDAKKVVAAIRFLHDINEFYEFDKKERITKVNVWRAPNGDEVAAHVGNLLDLRELRFESPGLTDAGLHNLKPLVKLRKLRVKSPLVTGDGLACLAGMKRLQKLSLHGEQLDGRGFQYLAKPRNLVELNVTRGTYCDDDLAPLASLAKLEEISLAHSNALQGTFAAHLPGLPKLRKLSLGEQVTDEGLACIAQLSNLETLYIEGPFTDAGLMQLRTLQRLKTLGVHSPHVTHMGLSVVAELPKLESLSLETPRVTDDAIPIFTRCLWLEDLDFRTPALSDSGLQYLRDTLPRCEILDLVRDSYKGTPRDEEQKNRPRYESDTPLQTLVAQASDWDLVNGTFLKISDRYCHWVDAAAYSPLERVIMLVWHGTGLIDNGGFEYLFGGEFPGDPDFRITAEACKTAGLVRSYEAFQEAFSLFPGGIVPHDPAERTRLFDATNRSARDAIKRKFWRDGYDHLVEKKLAEFIRKHAAELDYLDEP